MEVRRTASTTQTSVLLLYHLNVSIERFFLRIVPIPLDTGMTFASDTSQSISLRNSKMTDLRYCTFISR